MEALRRYAQFYNITVREELEKEEVAAVVARHFDCTLEVEEDDSIVSFIQRIRNGERNPNKRTLSDKERKLQDKKRKKSNSRKRQRDTSTAAPVASSGAASTSSGSGAAASGGREASGSSNGPSEDNRKASSSLSSASASGSAGNNPSSSSSGSSNSHKPTHKKSSDSKKKEKDNGEDNELYCICNLPSYGNMIACDGKKCPNPSQWYHLECVGFSDGRHPDTWLCPECDPKGFAAFQSKKKKSNNKQRSKSPGSSK